MAYDFNKITEADEKAAVAKFKEYDRGVVMGTYGRDGDQSNESKWGELMNEKAFNTKSIQNKMIAVAARVNNTINDEMLGDMSVAFSMTTSRGKRVKFSWLEIYSFLRAALRERKASAEYQIKAAKAKELQKFIDEHKSVDTKVAEANAALDKLKAECGEDIFTEEA